MRILRPREPEVKGKGARGRRNAERKPATAPPCGLLDPSPLPRLDKEGKGRTWEPWSRGQRSCFHRVSSWLVVKEHEGAAVFWIGLTSSRLSVGRSLWADLKELKKRIERAHGFARLEHFAVETREGLGVLHLLLAWKPGPGQSRAAFWIPKQWLSDTWNDIHKAYIVDITRYRGGRDRLSRYIVSQYVGAQSAFVRYAWSWRSFSFPLVRAWKALRRGFPVPKVCHECKTLLRAVGSAGVAEVRAHHPLPDRAALMTAWYAVLIGQRPVPA